MGSFCPCSVTLKNVAKKEVRQLAYLDWVQWPAMFVTVLAAWLIGSQQPKRRMSGFICFSFSNVLWVAWSVYAHAYALILLQICLFLMNLRGFNKNYKGR
ncbi:inner membrane protein [Pseudomonas sp. WPR_5_2]|nr:inner membrane protein [Pseudomonas sp. WPR_5_2]